MQKMGRSGQESGEEEGCTLSSSATNAGKCPFGLWKKRFLLTLKCYVLIEADCALFVCEMELFWRLLNNANSVR